MRIKTRMLSLALFLLALAGCGDSPRQLYETAELEELQNSHQHAMQLYEEIVEKHSKSEYAAKAREKLVALRARMESGGSAEGQADEGR